MSIKDIRTFLLDMDGTIYLGNELFPETKEFLNTICDSGRRYIFLTNNSSKNHESYIKKLAAMGIKAEDDEIYTSGDAAAAYIVSLKKAPSVYLLGTPELEQQFTAAGIVLTDRDPDYVVLGFDTTLTYEKIKTACAFVSEGIPWICTHPDLVCPVEGGKTIPDTGAMTAMISAATGKQPDTVIGKPNRIIIDMIIAKYGIDRETTMMVGDRLYTDIAVGARAGIKSALVYTGETSRQQYETQNEYHADYVYDSVGDISEELKKQ